MGERERGVWHSHKAVGGEKQALELTLAVLLVAVQLVANVATALVAAKRVDALVLAAMVLCLALVHLLHEDGREARLLHRCVRHEFHVHRIAT